MQTRERLLTAIGGSVFAVGVFGFSYELTDLAASTSEYVPHISSCAAPIGSSEYLCKPSLSNVEPLARKTGDLLLNFCVTTMGGVLMYNAFRGAEAKLVEALNYEAFNQEWFNWLESMRNNRNRLKED